VEGSQHVRATRYKTSRFDTSIFILQNAAARSEWPVTEALCRRLADAFASKFQDEVDARQNTSRSKANGGQDRAGTAEAAGTEPEPEETRPEMPEPSSTGHIRWAANQEKKGFVGVKEGPQKGVKRPTDVLGSSRATSKFVKKKKK